MQMAQKLCRTCKLSSAMVEINNKKFIIMCIDREKMSGKIEKER